MAWISCHTLNFVLELNVFYYLQVDYWEQVKFNHGVGILLKIRHFCTTEEAMSATVTDAVILTLILPVDSNGEDKWKLTDIIIHFFTP